MSRNYRNISKYEEQRVLDAAMRKDFSSFLQKTFQITNPGRVYLHNWHIEALAWHLQQCAKGKIKRLIITVPPRSGKSLAASVAFPAWLLGLNPSWRIICVSYSSELARKHSIDARAVMESEFYRRIFPGTQISLDKNTELEFMTTARGFRLATSVDGTLTGRGGDIIIIDDPMKPADAMSDAVRERINSTYDNTLFSRLDSKVDGIIVVVMQRLHPDDLVGHVLTNDDWTVLNMPAIFDVDETFEVGPGSFYRAKAGEVLHPAREPLGALERIKKLQGTYAFSAQYLQQPLPAGGNIVKPAWFKTYDALPPSEGYDQIVQSWDTASKAGELNDFSVCTTWRIHENNAYLIDVQRDRLDYPSLRQRVIEVAADHKPISILIEDTGSGTSLLQDLEKSGLNCIGVKPESDKTTRLSTVSATIEAGRVYLPKEALWLGDFLAEMMQFPHGRFDDQVDSVSQFLNWMRERDLYRVDGGIAGIGAVSFFGSPFIEDRLTRYNDW